jgi:hypothetical protein
MGNKISTPPECEFNGSSNYCAVGPCIFDIHGHASNSTSPTDIWLLHLAKGTTYNSTPNSRVFLKIWISSDSFKNATQIMTLDDDTIEDIITTSLALDYETKIYRDIIKPLIDQNICPHFIKFMGVGRDCSFDSMVDMLNTSNSSLGEIDNRKALYRNVKCLISGCDNRPSINVSDDDPLLKGKEFGQDLSLSMDDTSTHIKFNMIANELIKPGTVTLNTYMNSEYVFLGNSDTINSKLFTVLFQSIAACYAMSLSKMVHNDLHIGNIYVEPFDKKDVHYLYNNELFTYETDVIVKLFDFDRSFVTSLGNNPLLTWYCDYSQCNKYIENLDVIKLMGGVYIKSNQMKGPGKHLDLILDICSSTTKGKNILKKTWDFSNNLVYNGSILLPKHYKMFNNTFDIMKRCSELADIQNIPDFVGESPPGTFICNPSMFVGKKKKKKSLTPCKPGKVMNPDTKRCRSPTPVNKQVPKRSVDIPTRILRPRLKKKK